MTDDTTIKALEELAKAEYTTASALDVALASAEDSNLRKNYRKWRDSHIKQGDALNGRIKQLGGHTTRRELRDGSLYPIFWSLIRGSQDHKTLAGVRLVVERGVRQYMERLEDINDIKSLDILRKNLETKQGEMKWYDDQVVVEHNHEIEAELQKTRELAKSLEKEAKEAKETRAKEEKKAKESSKDGKHGSAAPLAAIVVASAVGAAVYLITRRDGGDSDEDLFADDFIEPASDGAVLAETTS